MFPMTIADTAPPDSRPLSPGAPIAVPSPPLLRRFAASAARTILRRLLPSSAKHTLRQLLELDLPEQAPEPIDNFARGPVLVLAPHMDDEAIGCGGACLLHARAGARVRIVLMTDGRRGDPELYGQGLAPDALRAAEERVGATRNDETRRAAAILGDTDPIFLDAPDGALAPTPDLVGRLRALLAGLRPAVVYAPSMLDRHADHWATSRILCAALAAPSPLPPGALIREYEVWTPLVANRLVRIDDVLEDKRRALLQYSSQLERFDLVHVTLGLNAYRTLYPFKGVGAAEAFFESSPARFIDLHARWTARR